MATREVGIIRQHDPSYYVTALPISDQADRGESLGEYRRKAEEIGLTLSEVEQAIIELQNNDIPSIKHLSNKSLEIIKSVQYPQTTADLYKDLTTNNYTAERQQTVHEPLIIRALENQVRGETPRLLVLAGPLAAGKSATRKDFVSQVKSAVIADPDEIRHHLLQNFDPTNYSHVLATNQEAFDISDEIFKRAAEKGYNLIYEGTLRDIQSYRKARQSTQNYLIRGVYVAAKPEDCFIRGIGYIRLSSAPLVTLN